MRRKKDDKRVLVSPRDARKNNSRRHKIRRPSNNTRNNSRNNTRNKRKRSGLTVFLMILALVAFVIGAGIGISLSFDNDDEGPHWVNVTEEMTTGLNDTEPVYYDSELDDIDFNSNQTLTELNISAEDMPSY
ncbi:hypothetical protein [Methanobrevibacter sp.]|uniref:hypothetical protein n=1 Tax=Methanobrevibacter sp. TaxID=66852 RepID=UPI00386A4F8C